MARLPAVDPQKPRVDPFQDRGPLAATDAPWSDTDIPTDSPEAIANRRGQAVQDIRGRVSPDAEERRVADRQTFDPQGTQYLQAGEADRWSQERVTLANQKPTVLDLIAEKGDTRQQEMVENARLALKQKAVADIEGAVFNPKTGGIYRDSATSPLTISDAKSYLALNYPAIASSSALLPESDTMKNVNMTLALDAAGALTNTANPARAAQIFNTMGPDMQDIVVRILTTWQEDGAAAAATVQEQSAGNTILDAGKTAWGYTLGPAFDALWEGTQLGLRSATTLGWILAGNSPDAAWEATAPGSYNPEGVRKAREVYGALTVDLIMEAKRRGLEDVDTIGAMYADFPGVENAAVLDALFFNINTDQNTQDAITYVTSQDMSNFGNFMFWSQAAMATWGTEQEIDPATGEPVPLPLSDEGVALTQTALYTGARDTWNVVGMFAFDPTLLAGKALAAYKGARYGMQKLAPGRIEQAFQDPNVRRFWDTFGDMAGRAQGTTDLAERGQRFNTLRSQYKSWFNTEGVNELVNAGVRNADDALDYFRGADNLRTLLNGQPARRSHQFQIPHMMLATAQVKRLSMLTRGLTYDRGAAAQIDQIFGPGVSQMVPEEAITPILRKLSEDGGDQFVGQMLSDFVYADGAARRTFMGKVMDTVVPRGDMESRLQRWSSRYGWQRKTLLRGDVRPTVERWTRILAHQPNTAGHSLWIADGRDADKIRDMALFAGMPKYWADVSADMWRQMDQGARAKFGSAMGRSAAYSLGVDQVDAVTGKLMIDNIAPFTRDGMLFAPDWQDVTALRGQATKSANARMTAEAADRKATRIEGDPLDPIDEVEVGLSKAGNVTIKHSQAYKDRLSRLVSEEMKTLRETAPWVNPSRQTDQMLGATGGLYFNQMTPQITFPNIAVMDQFSMRQSYITALLGTNPAISTFVDFWTLGTLAGPRFQARNGIEDAGLYAVTQGGWKGYRIGQQYKTAKREATARPRKSETRPVQGEQLGVVESLSRWLGDQLPTALNAYIKPHLSSAEIAHANSLAAKGDRQGLVDLINKALLRGKVAGVGWKLDDQTITYLDQAAERAAFFHTMDDVSETTRHLSDGVMPGMDFPEEAMIAGRKMRMVQQRDAYLTRKVKPSDPESIKAWYNNLSMILHGDAGKGQKAVSMMPRYIAAKNSGNQEKINQVVDDFTEWINEKAAWVNERSQIAVSEGTREFARRNLDDVSRVFSTKSGAFNRDLYTKIRREDADGNVTLALWDEGADSVEYRLHPSDLQDMKGKPLTVLDYEGVKVALWDQGASMWEKVSNGAWTMMGRSLARMTREPIFVSNYLDARKLIAPLEKRVADDMGEAFATNWAVDIATDRAYRTSMSFMDNPAVRSQMAWQLRNVARFYRASEDFNRRMLRTTRFQPMAFQKLNLAWHVLDDTGFVQENEYGDKYFVWPGSQLAFDAVNQIVGLQGGLTASDLGLQFTSNINMITPSGDPNSWFPTFSSPFSQTALRSLFRVTPGLSSLEREMFGDYSGEKAIWEGIFPAHVGKLVNLAIPFIQGQESRAQEASSQFASNARAAIQAYAATGLWDETKNLTPEELRDMRNTIDIAALDISALRFILSPILFASPQLGQADVTEFAQSLGVSSMRQAWIQLLNKHEGDLSAAYVDWLGANPGKSVFTVATYTQGQNVGDFQPFKPVVQFIEANEQIVKDYPVGSAFFAPQEGSFNISAWNYLKAMGAEVPKTVDNYFKEMVTQTGYAQDRIYKAEAAAAIAGGSDPKQVEEGLAKAREWVYEQYPMTQSRLTPGADLSTFNINSKPDNMRVVEDIRGAATALQGAGRLDERGENALNLISMYDEARSVLGQLSKDDPKYSKDRSTIKGAWVNAITYYRTLYPDDRQFESLVYATSGALGFEIS